jgi:ketosteroid isomerase-like protein
MKRGVLFILVIFLLTGLGVVAQSSSDATASESKILALENAWGQAEKLRDTKALDSLLDDSLVYIRYDGSVWSKSKYLASLNDRTSHEDQAVNETMTAHLYGDAALVTGIYRVKGVEQGNPYSRRERFIDTWVRRNDGWICAASQVTLIGH